MIEEIHLTSSGFLEPHFLLKYKELFPQIKKLTIDPRERYRGRKLLDDYCHLNLWEIGQLNEILAFLASFKHLQIWKFKLTLMEGEPPKRVSFQGFGNALGSDDTVQGRDHEIKYVRQSQWLSIICPPPPD